MKRRKDNYFDCMAMTQVVEIFALGMLFHAFSRTMLPTPVLPILLIIKLVWSFVNVTLLDDHKISWYRFL